MPVVWLWMFIAGLGVGPTFSVFTIVIQNAVPFQRARRGDVEPDVLPPDRRHDRARLRRARSSGRRSRSNLVPQMTAAGVPPAGHRRASARRAASGQFDFNQLTGVGDLGAAILAAIPASSRRRSSRSAPSSQGSTGPSASATPRPSGSAWSARSWRSSPRSRSRRSRSGRTNEAPVPTQTVADGGRRRRPSPSRSRPAPSPATDPRSSSRSTAPVDPTGAVVRSRRVRCG